MKKCIVLLMAGILFLLSCSHSRNLTEEEREKYRKSNMRYKAGQTP